METLCRLSYRGRPCLDRDGETTRRLRASGNQPPGAVDERRDLTEPGQEHRLVGVVDVRFALPDGVGRAVLRVQLVPPGTVDLVDEVLAGVLHPAVEPGPVCLVAGQQGQRP